jgi:hypothetical protein
MVLFPTLKKSLREAAANALIDQRLQEMHTIYIVMFGMRNDYSLE